METKDKVLSEFPVLWEGWDCDSTAWVMERPDGTRYLKMTNHGGEYEADPEELTERIAEYEKVLMKSREALALLAPNKSAVLSRFPDAVCERYPGDCWTVFDIPTSMAHGIRWHGDVARCRGVWGTGESEAEAWADARRSIERHEGRKLTPN